MFQTKKKIFSLILFAFIIIGCSKEDNQANNCLNYKHAFITDVKTEILTVKKNYDLPIELTYILENSCGSFYAFDVERNDKIYDIKINTKYEGCNCKESVGSANTIYYFRAVESGFYLLKFYTSVTEFTSIIINVE